MILNLDNIRFLMDAGFEKSSWNKWQKTLFEEARKYDQYIFTGTQIEKLCDKLEAQGQFLRGDVSVRKPNWEFLMAYGGRPSIEFGSGAGCIIHFIPIEGEYEG